MTTDHKVSIVVLTHNRKEQVIHTLRELRRVAAGAPIILVDNGSTDGSADTVSLSVAGVQVLRSASNVGAAGRNLGATQVQTPYVAFCDDDTIWQAGALQRAADILDRHPDLAVISAHIVVGRQEKEDPACRMMEQSPLDSTGMPGRSILGFMAGACVMRVSAFRAVGGYRARFFIGAEEMLMALDMATHGYKLVYCPDIHIRHFPSVLRDSKGRRVLLSRNAIWVGWMRLPWQGAWKLTLDMLRQMHRDGTLLQGLMKTSQGILWALRHRKVVPPRVQAMWRATHSH